MVGFSEINKSSEMDFGEVISTRDAVRTNVDIEAQGASLMVRQLSEASRREIQDLVDMLMAYDKKLQTDGDRIQLDIEDYADLNHPCEAVDNNCFRQRGKTPCPERQLMHVCLATEPLN
jgi:hypothetical protein